VPGGEAERPTQIPARGWLQVAKRGWKEAKADHVPLLSAGVAYYAFRERGAVKADSTPSGDPETPQQER
jgi:hypothetical protein